jgi:hypothetical protein
MALTKVTGNVLESNLEIASVSSINGGPLAGFRNAIINGNFDIWQRGTSFNSASSEMTADRWRVEKTGSTSTITRQPFTLGQTDVPGEPTYFCRLAVTSVTGAANLTILRQYVEGVRTFAGQTATLSFWAKADTTKTIAIELAQIFGTGGSPSSNIGAIGVTKVTLTTSWQKFTKTVTLPSITGKTLGTNNNDLLEVNFWLDAGSNFNSRTDTLGHQSGTFDFAEVQLEPGPVETPFEIRPIGTELALCQRYFEIISMQSLTGTAGATTRVAFNRPYTVSKRANPNISVFSGTNTNFNVYRPGLEAVNSGISIFINNSTDGAAFSIEIGTFSALTNNQSWTGRFQDGKFAASAEL